tara:strand:- start:829 stop:1131 length:303 start_codon:yes stop_codon:yes gene_type:complete
MLERNMTDRIERILTENKSGVKTYAKYESAVKAADKITAEHIASIGNLPDNKIISPVVYVITYIPSSGRFSPVFLFNNWNALYRCGGYIGFFASQGFMSN